MDNFKKHIDVYFIILVLVLVCTFLPKGNEHADAQSTSSSPNIEVLTNMDEPNALPLLNNMLRQQANATTTLQGYFNSSGLLSPSSGGTGTDITSFPNGSILIYNASNVGIGTFGQGTSGQFLESQGAGALPTWGGSNHGIELFTTSGTFTAPITGTIYLTGCASGGGGGSGGGVSNNNGSGGGGAQCLINFPYSVTLNTNYTVTINPGGAGAASSSNNGTAGGNAVFDAITLNGGGAGAYGNSSTAGGAGAGGINGSPGGASSAGAGGLPGIAGGNGGSPSTNYAGGGGASAFGEGGNGGLPGGNATGYGAGGGGAPDGQAGNGAQGFWIAQW